MTTIEAATEFGQFTRKQAQVFLEEHGLTFEEAYEDIGDSVLDARELCLWLGY